MNVRPMFRRVSIAVFVILVPIVAHQLWDYIELRRLIGELDAIRARNEPVTEAGTGVGRAPETREAQRAGRLYTAAAVLESGAAFEVYATVESLLEWLSGAIPAAPADAASRLRAALEESAESLRLADLAAALPFQGFAPGTEYGYRTGDLNALTRLLAARTLSLAMSGQGDAAVESAVAVLTLQRAAGSRRFAARWGSRDETAAILSLSSPPGESLQRLQRALDEDERPGDDVRVLLQERARFVEQVWRRYYGSSPQTPGRYTLPMRSVTESMLRPWMTHHTVAALRIWAELIAAARTPWPGKADAVAAITARYGDRPPPRPFGDLRQGTLDSIRWGVAAQRLVPFDALSFATRPDDLVINRASRAALAVERFRRGHRGALPETLPHLVPDYLAAVPLDPVTGAPLLFRKEAASYTIYSVGPDKKDDGGDLSSELLKVIKQGYGRRAIRGADIGVRVLIR